MTDTFEAIHRIYNQALPKLATNFDVFKDKVLFEGAHQILTRDGEKITGFAITYKNGILLLCINPAYQKKGLGKDLLKKVEQHILAQGFKKISLGIGDGRYLLQGVPFDEQNKPYLFFEKYGYRNTWDSPCIDLVKDIGSANSNIQLNLPHEKITYKYCEKADLASLLKAVEIVDPNWVKFYTNADKLMTLIAADGEKVVGFTILAKTAPFTIPFQENVGSFGAIGVLPDYRKRGIGSNLIRLAELELHKNGLKYCYVSYTDREKFYRQLGYAGYMNFWMGERKNSAKKNQPSRPTVSNDNRRGKNCRVEETFSTCGSGIGLKSFP